MTCVNSASTVKTLAREATLAVKYCTIHGIGYQSLLDPVCPQCSLARMAPGDTLLVDENPSSQGFGYPIREGDVEGDRSLQKVK